MCTQLKTVTSLFTQRFTGIIHVIKTCAKDKNVLLPLKGLNISETTGPIKVKFHIKLLWDGGTKVCSIGPGHMTKMAAMPVYMVKTLKNLLQADEVETWYAAQVVDYYQVCSNDDPGLTVTYLRQCQIWSLMFLYRKKVKQ